jgi:hypothetical protein
MLRQDPSSMRFVIPGVYGRRRLPRDHALRRPSVALQHRRSTVLLTPRCIQNTWEGTERQLMRLLCARFGRLANACHVTPRHAFLYGVELLQRACSMDPRRSNSNMADRWASITLQCCSLAVTCLRGVVRSSPMWHLAVTLSCLSEARAMWTCEIWSALHLTVRSECTT